MTENTKAQTAAKAPVPVTEDRTFIELLKSLVGKTVTIVSPESYEDAPVGHQIRASYYRARPIGLGKDYLILMTEYVHAGRDTSKEPVKQFIPFVQIKRISLMKSERLLHL